MLVARVSQVDRALLLIELEFLAREVRDDRIDRNIETGAVFRRARDDERRARLVDQDRIDFVDDREGVAALDHLRHVVLHVVAQVVEAELVVRAVGHVRGVGLSALIVVQAMHDDADGHAEELVDLTHPLGVAAGKVVVHRDDVDALSGESVQINGGRGDERLALAGAHFGDRAFVQHQPAHELDIEVTLLERPLGGFTHGGEGWRNEIVERLAGFEFGPEFFRLGAQLIVAQRLRIRAPAR